LNRHRDLPHFIRDACRQKGVSLGEASRALGHSRNWLERVANGGIRRPRVEACQAIARYFSEDPNYILQLAGYVTAPPTPTPLIDELISIAHLLSRNDKLALLEYARLLKFRASAVFEQPQFPAAGINWARLEPTFARELASFISQEPATAEIWAEALQSLPEKAVELLLLNAQNQVVLRSETERNRIAEVLTQLAHTL